MLSNVGLHKIFWAEVVDMTYCLVIGSPLIPLELKNLEEVWSSKPTNYFDMRIFWNPANMHMNDGKLEPNPRNVSFLDIY